MPRVLHAVDQFLPRSETFVYTVVTAHRRFEASVICNARANADEFPFPRVHEHPRPRSRRTAAWWLDRVDRARHRPIAVAARRRDDHRPARAGGRARALRAERLRDGVRHEGARACRSSRASTVSTPRSCRTCRSGGTNTRGCSATAICSWPKGRRCARRSSPPARPRIAQSFTRSPSTLESTRAWIAGRRLDGSVRRPLRRKERAARRDRRIRPRARARLPAPRLDHRRRRTGRGRGARAGRHARP